MITNSSSSLPVSNNSAHTLTPVLNDTAAGVTPESITPNGTAAIPNATTSGNASIPLGAESAARANDALLDSGALLPGGQAQKVPAAATAAAGRAAPAANSAAAKEKASAGQTTGLAAGKAGGAGAAAGRFMGHRKKHPHGKAVHVPGTGSATAAAAGQGQQVRCLLCHRRHKQAEDKCKWIAQHWQSCMDGCCEWLAHSSEKPGTLECRASCQAVDNNLANANADLVSLC